MEIPTGVHCNHKMVSALSFICVCVFVIVFVFVFVPAYTARKILLLSAFAIQRNHTQERKFFHIILYLKQHLFLAMKQLFICMQDAE